MYRVAMELGAEECNEKVNPCSQANSAESPIGSEKLEPSRSDLTEDDEMLTAESEDEEMENGMTDVGPGGDNKLIKTTKIVDNEVPSGSTVTQALDMTKTGEGDGKGGRDDTGSVGSSNAEEKKTERASVLFGLDGHRLDGPFIAGRMKKVQGTRSESWMGMFDVRIPQIVVEGPEEDTKPTDQLAERSDDINSLLEGSHCEDDGDSRAKNESNVHLEETGGIEQRSEQEEADELLKHSVQQLIDDPIFNTLMKIESGLARDTEDIEPDKKHEVEAAAPLQTEESEIPPNSQETGKPDEDKSVSPEGKETVAKKGEEEIPHFDRPEINVLIHEEEEKILMFLDEPDSDEATDDQDMDLEDSDDMDIESESHGKFLEDQGKVKRVKPQISMTRAVEPMLELIPEIDELEESGLESVDIVKCGGETGGPESEETSAESEETQQPNEVESESPVEPCQDPESEGRVEEEESKPAKSEELETEGILEEEKSEPAKNEELETEERLEGEKSTPVKNEELETEKKEDEGEKGSEEAKSLESEQGEAEPDAVEEVSEVDQEKSEGLVAAKAEKRGKGKGKEKESAREGEERQNGEKQKGENDTYLRPRGRSFPFKLKVMGVPMSVTRDEIIEYFAECGEVLKAWRENKRTIQVVMADEEGYKKALTLRKPRIADAEIWIQSVSESMAVVTGIPCDMDPEEVSEKLMALIESTGVCVCRIVTPRTEPKTEDNPNPPLQGYAYVYFPDAHSLEKVRGTLRLELGDQELGMFANRSIFEERFSVHVSPLQGELPRSVLDRMVREALAPAGRIATVNLVQARLTEGLSANVIFTTQDAAQKATMLEGVEILGKPVSIVPFVQNEHGQRDRQLWVRVNNMPKDVTEEEVKKHFAIAGEPKEIMLDVNQGICMLIMESEAAVQKCLSLHQTYLRTDRIVVLLSDPYGGRKNNNRAAFRRQGGRAQSRNSSRRSGGEGHGDGASASFEGPHSSGQGQQPRANRGGGGGFTRSAFRGGHPRGGGGGGAYDRERGRGAFGRGMAPRFSRSRGFSRNRDKSPDGDGGAAAGGK